MPFIVKHWQAFTKGERKKIKLAIWNKQKIISFYLSREKTDKETMVIRMRPSNFLFRAVLDSMYFTMNIRDKTLVKYKGLTDLKEKQSDGRYRDYKGLVHYKFL